MSLTGLEQTMSQLKLGSSRGSPSPNNYKPLPPAPSLGRRISLSPARSKQPSTRRRRTSSSYSHASGFYADLVSQQPIEEHPVPKIRSIYRDSGITGAATMSEPQLLLPRTYNPLLATPSSGRSPAASVSPAPREHRPSELLPPPIAHPRLPAHRLQTITLEKAKAVQDAPGSEHLLPEELRARVQIRSKSSTHVNDVHEAYDKPQKPGSAFKIHDEPMRLPTMMFLDTIQRNAPSDVVVMQRSTGTDSLWSGPTAIGSSREQSMAKSEASVPEVTHFEQPERGRSLRRVPRGSVRVVNVPRNADSMAAEYADLLDNPFEDDTQPYDLAVGPFQGPLTPWPLFSKADHVKYEFETSSTSRSPGHKSLLEEEEEEAEGLSDYGTPPPDKFFDHESDDERQSGVIPISPPPSAPAAVLEAASVPSQTQNSQYRLISHDAKRKQRESAYYPYVGRRRQHAKTKPSAIKIVSPVQRHSLAVRAARTAALNTESPAAKKTSGEVPQLLSKAASKAVRLADKLKRPAEKHEEPPVSPPTLNQSVTGVYLGWSEESKDDFDASKPMSPKLHYAVGKYNPRPSIQQGFTHVQTPARPLDERAVGLTETSERPQHARKGSFFGSLIEMSREKGREKRREDIKKTIRMIPAPATHDGGLATEERPTLVEKSLSEPEVPTSATETAPTTMYAIWGRRVSEFGLL